MPHLFGFESEGWSTGVGGGQALAVVLEIIALALLDVLSVVGGLGPLVHQGLDLHAHEQITVDVSLLRASEIVNHWHESDTDPIVRSLFK